MLKEEIRKFQRSEERKKHIENSEYVKNIILKVRSSVAKIAFKTSRTAARWEVPREAVFHSAWRQVHGCECLCLASVPWKRSALVNNAQAQDGEFHGKLAMPCMMFRETCFAYLPFYHGIILPRITLNFSQNRKFSASLPK